MNVTVNTFYQYFGLQEVKSIWKVEKKFKTCVYRQILRQILHSFQKHLLIFSMAIIVSGIALQHFTDVRYYILVIRKTQFEINFLVFFNHQNLIRYNFILIYAALFKPLHCQHSTNKKKKHYTVAFQRYKNEEKNL